MNNPYYTEDEQQTIISDMATNIYDEQYSITEQELKTDTLFLEASRNVYKYLEQSNFQGTDEELASYGLNKATWINNNLASLGKANIQFDDADDYSKLSLYYLMDTYDKKDISAAGVGRTLLAMGADPLNYVGIGTLGLGLVGKKAGQVAAKQTFLQGLKASASNFIASNPVKVAATEGALYGGAFDAGLQNIEVGASNALQGAGYDAKSEIDALQTGLAASLTGGLTGSFTAAAPALANVVKKWADEGAIEMEKLAGGGAIPESDLSYQMDHTSPRPTGANSGDNVSDIFPDDIYSPQGYRYYGHGGDAELMDKNTINIMKTFRNNPDKEITIYRAVPKGVKEINPSDWVTINKQYAKEHGENHLDKGYKIIEKKVKAKDIFTDGGSIHEWGYHPQSVEKTTTSSDLVSSFQKDIDVQKQKHGNLNDLDYNMMDISDRDLTRIQRAKNTIEEIQTDPENAVYTTSTFNEFEEFYPDELKYAKITPEVKGNKVKIYRSATGDIEPGDWIGLNKKYADSHSRTDKHKVYEMWVDKEDIRWQGADANEWIYLPKELVDADLEF